MTIKKPKIWKRQNSRGENSIYLGVHVGTITPSRPDRGNIEKEKHPITNFNRKENFDKERLDYILGILGILRSGRANRLKEVVRTIVESKQDVCEEDPNSRTIREKLAGKYLPYKCHRKTFSQDLNDLGRIELLKLESKRGASKKISLHETLRTIILKKKMEDIHL